MKVRGIGPLLLMTIYCASASYAITIDMVTVGNPGNAPDTRYNGISVGSVDHVYQIGKYEVTAGQYTKFLNSVAKADPNLLYSPGMGDLAGYYGWGANIKRSGSSPDYSYGVAADWADRPINWVNFWQAARFANWLCNGQPVTGIEDASTTEDGAYTLNGYNDTDGTWITRNPGAKFWIPSEDEWYKAAYHKNNGVTADYWDYPTRSNAPPINTLPDSGNHACFRDNDHTGNGTYTIGYPYGRTEEGTFSNSAGPYGTFDQGGNVAELNDTIVYDSPTLDARGFRGGSWQYGSVELSALSRQATIPLYTWEFTGIRIAGSVPEPNSFTLAAPALLFLLVRGWRLTKA